MLLIILWVTILPFFSCDADDSIEKENVDSLSIDDTVGFVYEIDSVNYNKGILIYNADQGKQFWTEFNTPIRYYFEGRAKSVFKRKFVNDNPYLECSNEGGSGSFGVKFSVFGDFFDDSVLPAEISDRITGLRFTAFGTAELQLTVRVYNISQTVISEQTFDLDSNALKSFEMEFNDPSIKEMVFFSQSEGGGNGGSFGVDNVYLKTESTQAFYPPESEEDFLTWLKRASYNFFEWNYEESDQHAVVLESYADDDKVSLSGMGYAYAIYVIAAEDGYITKTEAKNRIHKMLKWQVDQNWFDGSGGWHGIPHHYFRKDGSNLFQDVSTIDWAICAAGIRVARSYYQDDQEIVAMADTLLSRPNWKAAVAEDNKIAMGFEGSTGAMNSYRWGLAFSEETEIVYLEAVASGDLSAEVFDGIFREEKHGFYPSWFGAGFTYNWLQLWTGPMEPYQSNSIEAFEVDASTCQEKFGQPVMGLTACATVKQFSEDGFANWGQYISNQGGLKRLTNGSVIQISPAPYGAALALPFNYHQAITALKTYVDMGYYHEYLGLPDNVRLRDLPNGQSPVANWDPFDINIGPMIMAIEQVQANRISDLYLSDPEIEYNLPLLIDSFEK